MKVHSKKDIKQKIISEMKNIQDNLSRVQVINYLIESLDYTINCLQKDNHEYCHESAIVVLKNTRESALVEIKKIGECLEFHEKNKSYWNWVLKESENK